MVENFNKHLRYVQRNSAYYKRKLEELGLADFQLSEIEDVRKLPLTSKDDLANHGSDFISAPMSEVRDIVTTSGTLGDPVSVFVTENDLDRLGRNEAGSFRIAGCDKNDTLQLLTTIDKRFMAGLAYFLGSKELGARMIRSGPGALELQWDSILRYKPTVLIAVPSFIPSLIKYARKKGIDPNTTSVKKIIAIGEPLRNNDLQPNHLATAITDAWNVQLFSTYASTEMATAFTECEHGRGAHIQPDLVHLEVLDDNDRNVTDGGQGEVVVTPLHVEGLALLRYRTGDICRLYEQPCPCGRPGPRLGPVIGRKQQLLKLKGTSIYPNAVIDLLSKNNQVQAFLLEASSNDLGLDELTVVVALYDGLNETALSNELAEKLRVRPNVQLSTKDDINRKKFNENSRKPKIFFDLRQQG